MRIYFSNLIKGNMKWQLLKQSLLWRKLCLLGVKTDWAVVFINLWGQMEKLCYGRGYYYKKVNMALDFLKNVQKKQIKNHRLKK